MSFKKNKIEDLDQNDPLSKYKSEFHVSDKNLCYLDGNSLGRLPLRTINKINFFLKEEWGKQLVEGWEHWIDEAQKSGDMLARNILGGNSGEVLVCDTTSINFYQLCSAVVRANPKRNKIITDSANFPTDRYILEGIADQYGLELIFINNETVNNQEYERITVADLEPYLSDGVSLATFQVLQYRSGALNPIKEITELVNSYGAMIVWDASHAAGSVELDFKKNNIDLAVGCTYKYLCAGPGSPAWLYVSKKLQNKLNVPIQGWFAQKDQFGMGPKFQKSPDIRGFQIASPSLLGIRCVNSSIELIEEAGLSMIIEKARKGTELMIDLYDEYLAGLDFKLMTPRDAKRRGGHISLMHKHAKKISVALRRFERVIVDYRTPDQIRIAISPLAMTYDEVFNGMKRIRESVIRKDYLKVDDNVSEVT
tara:strand:- start:669 stop:1940 length:1272 start_codon:yes stop_codon:yes gene_type:complete